MNLILFDRNELQDSGRIVLGGRRAEHVRNVLRVQPGQAVRVGQISGTIGSARVIAVAGDGVTIELEHAELFTAENASADAVDDRVDVLAALPRPQTLKKVLEAAAVFGVGRVVLCGASGVEKSFFQSSMLTAEKIREHLLLGLEQAVDTRLPEVIIRRTLREGIAELRNDYQLKLAPHPGASAPLAAAWCCPQGAAVAAAIGPERGWTDREVRSLTEAGFTTCDLGKRIFRVETALTAVLANVSLLRTMEGTRDNRGFEDSR